jgi:hypothetical protein
MSRILAASCLLLVMSTPSWAAAPALSSREIFRDVTFDGSAPQAPAPQAIIYSDAYETRAKIHKIAAFAVLPLFAGEAFVGQSLYNNPTDAKRTAHLVLATSIAGLFGLNSVTGVWNMVESRHDPNGRKLRLTHGILMLSADAGFLATALMAPGHQRNRVTGERELAGSAAAHRAMAFTAMGLGTVGYTIMLFGGH